MDDIYECLSQIYGVKIDPLTIRFREARVEDIFTFDFSKEIIYMYKQGIEPREITTEVALFFQKSLWKDCPEWFGRASLNWFMGRDWLKGIPHGLWNFLCFKIVSEVVEV